MYRFEFNGFTADVMDYSKQFDGYLLRVHGEQKRLSDEDYELGIAKLEEIDSAVECYDKDALLKCNLDFGYYAEGAPAPMHTDMSRKAILIRGKSAVKLREIISEIKQRNLEKILVRAIACFLKQDFRCSFILTNSK